MTKMVYFFGEGNKSMKELLGGKGANLNEMTNLDIPVPSGFTVTTEACEDYYASDKKISDTVMNEVLEHMKKLEEKMKMKFGDLENPLLVSVRSGAAVSMPGMMDTVLNLGLNDNTVKALAKKSGNERFAFDAYRRFIQMFGDVVMGIDHSNFEHILDRKKKTKEVEYDTDLTVEDLKEVVFEYKEMIKENAGKLFPEEPIEQLRMSIDAVFGSWHNERADTYRKLNDIRGLKGTAVNVQAMVFGNMGETSGTGVAFTRNPSDGDNKLYGEFLMNAQGEDVVAGIRTPKPISQLKDIDLDAYNQFQEICHKLEKHYKEMQDLEFTIQDKTLFILQTRTGKRTAHAAIKIAVEMVNEGLIDKKTALLRVEPKQLNQLLHKQLDPVAKQNAEVAAIGLPASPGAAVGMIVFDADTAAEWDERGDKVILVRTETSPEDIKGMSVAQGILTSRGGMTSHAAVVARGMGKCCVAGCSDVYVKEKDKTCRINGKILKEGDSLTLDGATGEVFTQKIAVRDPELSDNFKMIMDWADSYRKLGVRTNADTPHDSEIARKFGAEGIGLTRTEHMFFEGDRIDAVREMILAHGVTERKVALNKLLPMQRQDFKGIFKAMEGLPVTIRLLDPPLHEFLPQSEADILELAKMMSVDSKMLKEKVESLEELNPMLGHRGVRLAITYPEIAEMQVTAIMEAATELKKDGVDAQPEIMIPLVGHINELKPLVELTKKIADKIIKDAGVDLKYKVGTMIEVPRAALTADEIAKEAEFFSFGTNDLTQMTFGFSRDDVGKFTPEYLNKGIFDHDPFVTIDQSGVGQLMKMAKEKGSLTRPDIKVGICGEQGGEARSVDFCHRIGLHYVSCSPFRVPIARLAAAHAAINAEKK